MSVSYFATIKNGVLIMYSGRDFTELSMMSLKSWENDELAYFHHSFQQIMPYLNQEGQSIYKAIVKEIESRDGLQGIASINGTYTAVDQ